LKTPGVRAGLPVARHTHARTLSLRLSQLLATSLKLAAPIVFPVVGAAMLIYGWTTP
jgi:hypothetical protein